MVIVLIISVAMMFLLFFTTRGPKQDKLRQFDKETHAYNTIISMIQSNTKCRHYTISDVLKNCALQNEEMPYDCSQNSVTMCEYAKRDMDLILNRSLGFINEPYYLYVYTELNQDSKIIELGEECNTPSITSATQPIRYPGGDMYVVLQICS